MSGKKAKKERKAANQAGSMPKLPQEVGKCIFCQEQGNMSKQHFFPDWMQQYVKSSHKVTTHTTSAPVDGMYGSYFNQKTRDGNPGSHRIRKVCIPCNGTWVNTLETNMQPAFIEIVQNRKTDLNKVDQQNLSIWAVLATMVFEFKDQKTVAVSQDDRTFLFDHKAIPKGWQLWVARKAENLKINYYKEHRSMEIRNLYSMFFQFEANAQCSIFVAANLVFFTTMTPDLTKEFRFEGNLQDKFKRIHPISIAHVEL